MTFRRAAVLVFLAGFLAAAAGLPTRASYGARVTGDEPQYLITAQSLWSDGDLDVSNQIAAGSYRPFHEVGLDRQTRPLEGGREVSPHDPLLPALLTLPTALGGWVGAKLFLATISGLLAVVLLMTAVRRMGLPLGPSALLVGLFSASAPLAVYGNQVYPEIAAALCVAGGLWALHSTRPREAAILATAVIALPWLSIKYTAVAAALALLGLWSLWREGERRLVSWVAFAYVLAGATYVLGHLEWYGGVTPYATGDHFAATGEFSVVGTGVDLGGRSARLIGLLVDRDFGLAAWQPAYLLLVPAAVALVRRRKRAHHDLAIGLVAGVGWLNATFVALTMHGWWWPGRQVVVIAPALVLLVLRWVADEPRVRLLAYGLGAIGVVNHLWVAVEGALGRLTWVVDFYETGAPAVALMSRAFPDYTLRDGETWLLHALWLSIFAAAAVVTWRSASGGEARGAAPVAGTATTVP